MRFLAKNPDSPILKQNLQYLVNNPANNKNLKMLLLEEQKNFCAYTEKYVDGLDSVEVEHFNAAKKYRDDYYNYYAVLRKANIYKKDEKYKDAPFFDSLFFQTPDEFSKRIIYVKGDFIYMKIDVNDTEAAGFIDFLGLNQKELTENRKRHIARLKVIFSLAHFNYDKGIEYFRKHKDELKFITAIEVELDIDLSEFYK